MYEKPLNLEMAFFDNYLGHSCLVCWYLLQVIARDLKNLGYVFQFSKLDAQNYLLNQRRTRVYGTGDLDEGQNADSFRESMRATLSSLSSDIRFPFETVFDENLPKISLRGNAYNKVQEAIEKFALQSQSNNIFVDTSTSKDRQAECAVSITTCIRPSHPIWSVRLSRFVTTEEMFRCQGLWKDDFSFPQAISDVLADPTGAQDLAGNAFASTCAQAQVIASLVNAMGWAQIGARSRECVDQSSSLGRASSNEEIEPETQGSVPSDRDTPSSSPRNNKRKGSLEAYFEQQCPGKRSKFEIAPAAKPFQDRGQGFSFVVSWKIWNQHERVHLEYHLDPELYACQVVTTGNKYDTVEEHTVQSLAHK